MASAARARAAILVLIDMTNSIRLRRYRCGPRASLDGGFSLPVRIEPGRHRLDVIVMVLQLLSRRVGTDCQLLHVEVIDLGEQLAECAGALVDEFFAVLGGGLRCIADRAGRMQILRLPGKWRGPLRGEPAIIPFHCD